MATTRRQFLLAGLGAAAVPTLARLTWARPASALPRARDGRILVVVELAGGNDGLNTVVPFGDERYAKARPTLKLARNDLLVLEDGLGLRKELVGLKERFDRGQLALVQGVGYPRPDRSHFRSTDIWHTASLEPENERTGWIGRLCECEGSGGAKRPPALMVGSERVPLLLVGEHATAPQVDDVARFRLPTGPEDGGTAGRRKAMTELAGGAKGDAAKAGGTLDFLKESARETQANVLQIEAATRRARPTVAYPDGALAQELKLAGQLIAGGFDCTAYFVRQSGYDTHAFQQEQHALLLSELGGALTAFLADVEAAKALDRVVVLVYSEFGRRVEENGSKGTDHGAAAPVFVLGGGVKGGIVGAHPSLAELEDGDVKFATDFRRIYATLLQEWLGVAPKRVLGADYAGLPLFA